MRSKADILEFTNDGDGDSTFNIGKDDDGVMMVMNEGMRDSVCLEAATTRSGEVLPFKKFLFAQYMVTPKALRKEKKMEFCDRIRIAPHTFNRWKGEPDIQFVMKKLRRLYFVDFVPDVVEALRARAMMGDINAINTFLKYTGEFDTEEMDEGAQQQANKLTKEQLQQKVALLRERHGSK